MNNEEYIIDNFAAIFNEVDVGIAVVDTQLNLVYWNDFMQNHSGVMREDILGKNLLTQFQDLPKAWLRQKFRTVLTLKTRTFSTWEQKPYVFKFRSYQPITGIAEYMYQNMSLLPITNSNGQITHIGIIIHDVTDVAINKSELQSANILLQQMSRQDALTQLYNRGYWEERIREEHNRFTRTHEAVTLILFDIDHFKAVNDTYGHPAGDEVLRKVSAILAKTCRETDIPGRYGGEEFGIALIGCDESSARIFAERLRSIVERYTVSHAGTEINVTISLGICQNNEQIVTYKDWIALADQALYQSKQHGRNRITCVSELA
jgi:diguanylate cyclase (GGDEF)-like protein/PAS domain S-box-containing protein